MTTPRRVARRMWLAFLAAFPRYAQATARAVADVTPTGAIINGGTVGREAWKGKGKEREGNYEG